MSVSQINKLMTQVIKHIAEAVLALIQSTGEEI